MIFKDKSEADYVKLDLNAFIQEMINSGDLYLPIETKSDNFYISNYVNSMKNLNFVILFFLLFEKTQDKKIHKLRL